MQEINKQIPYEVSDDLYSKVLDRDGEVCRVCGSPYLLECHHIVNRGADGRSDICNLVMLCKSCHADAGSGRGKWSKTFYNELEHINPIEAFIHTYDFKTILCTIHNKPIQQ